MAKNAHPISQFTPIVTDSLISVPEIPSILIRRDSVSQTLFPHQKLTEVKVDSVRNVKAPYQQTKSARSIQKSHLELSHSDSIKFNLIQNNKSNVDWEMKFDFHTQFNDTAYTLIDPRYLQADSLQENKEIHKPKSTQIQSITSIETPNDHTYNYKLQRDRNLHFNHDWLFGLLVFSAFIIGLVKVKYSKYLKDLFASFLYPTLKDDKLLNTNISNRIPSYLLVFLFYFNSALFVYQLSTVLKNPLFGLSGSLVIPAAFLFLFIIFSLKIIVYKIAGSIFGTKVAIHRYLNQSANTSKIFAIILLPFIILIPFSTESTIALLYKMVFAIFVFLYILQVGRGIKNNLTSIFSLYYIILYLCALEIVPLTLLYKVLFK